MPTIVSFLDNNKIYNPIMDITQRISKNIRRLRKERKLTQEVIAGLDGLHPKYIGMIERCERQITVVSLEKISNALNVGLIDLVE